MPSFVALFSGGLSSWAAAKRVAEQYGTEGLILLFADTRMEDEDLYRFLPEAAADIGGQLVTIADGRDPWQVFRDERMLGNSRMDPCSKILKRRLIDAWWKKHANGDTTAIYGFTWDEERRAQRLASRLDRKCLFPLLEAPYETRDSLRAKALAAGLRPPRLYDMGFAHNNCGGFCIKAGQAAFKNLLEKMPERYAYHEEKEQEMRAYLGKNVSILRDRTGGTTKRLTLKVFRQRVEAGQETEQMRLDWGSCSCIG